MQVKFTLLVTLVQIVNIQIYNVYCSSNDSIQRRQEDNNENHHLQLSSNRSLFFSNTAEIVANDEDTKVIDPLPTNLIVPKKNIKQVSKITSNKFQLKYSKNMKKIAHNGAKLVKVSINSLWQSVISIFNIIQATFDFAAKKMILFFDHPSEIMTLPYDAFKIMKTNVNFPFQFFKKLY